MVAIISEGATLNIGGAVGLVTSLSISHSRYTIDVSNMATAGGKEFLAAKLFEAEITAEVQFDSSDTGQAAILGQFAGTDIASPSATSWSLNFTAGTFAGNGFVTAFDVSGSLDSVVTASVTLKVSGDITQG